MKFNSFGNQCLNLFHRFSYSDTTGKIWDINPQLFPSLSKQTTYFIGFLPHFRPACFSMLLSVPLRTSSPLFSATVTSPYKEYHVLYEKFNENTTIPTGIFAHRCIVHGVPIKNRYDQTDGINARALRSGATAGLQRNLPPPTARCLTLSLAMFELQL